VALGLFGQASFITSGAYEVVWSGQRKLAIARLAVAAKDRKGDDLYELLTEFDPRTNETLRSVPVAHFEAHRCTVVGDGDRLPLVLKFSLIGVGVESFFYEIVDTSFRLSPLYLGMCWGIHQPYVLSSRDNRYPPPRGKDRYQDLQCQTIDGKRTYWRHRFRFGEFTGAEWAGDRVVVHKKTGDVVLNARTGKRIDSNY
jgi:hypothetical protein